MYVRAFSLEWQRRFSEGRDPVEEDESPGRNVIVRTKEKDEQRIIQYLNFANSSVYMKWQYELNYDLIISPAVKCFRLANQIRNSNFPTPTIFHFEQIKRIVEESGCVASPSSSGKIWDLHSCASSRRLLTQNICITYQPVGSNSSFLSSRSGSVTVNRSVQSNAK